MEETTTTVSPSELQKLLYTIADRQPDICIRYRSLGHLWYPNFLKVLKIQESGNAVFHDELCNKLISFSDISSIVQFELDSRFLHFEPNCHYQISDENHCKEQ